MNHNLFCALALSTSILSSTAFAEKKPLEERRFFRPFRIGICAGWSNDCALAGIKTEFSGKYIGGTLAVGPLTMGLSAKAYPAGAYHFDAVTWRPYVQYGIGGFWGTTLKGGGVGTDIHLLKSKRLMIQPTVSFMEECDSTGEEPSSCSIGPGGSLSVMAAF